MSTDLPKAATLSVIIVSYNTQVMTLECLESLDKQIHEIPSEVFVVDNCSTDGSPEAIRSRFPFVHLIESGTNRGFGAANNLAMQQACGEYFLLLNTDAFARPGAIAAMIEHLQRHPTVGVVGPRLLNQDGTLQRSCYRFPTPWRAWMENLWISSLFQNSKLFGDYRDWPHNALRDVDWAIGACLLVRGEVYEQVGGFDEAFFMYAEESDWQLRIRQAGWRIEFTPLAEVVHLGGASGKNEKAKINQHFFNSLDYYERKHHGILGLLSLRVAMFIGSLFRLILWTAVFCLQPAKRNVARAKLQLHSWLLMRQSTHWRLST